MMKQCNICLKWTPVAGTSLGWCKQEVYGFYSDLVWLTKTSHLTADTNGERCSAFRECKNAMKAAQPGQPAANYALLLDKLAGVPTNHGDCPVAVQLDAQIKQIADLTAERDKLTQWKREMMDVENSWDAQAVGHALGTKWGSAIRSQILPGIEALKAELARLRRLLEAAEEKTDGDTQ